MQNQAVTYLITSLKCSSCVKKVEDLLTKLTYIKNFQVDLVTKKLVLTYQDKEELARLKADLAKIDHQLEVFNPPKLAITNQETNLDLVKAIMPLVMGLIIMFLTIFTKNGSNYSGFSGVASGLIYAFISLVLTIVYGYSILSSGIKGFVKLNFNMYSLVSLGLISAWVYSSWMLIYAYFYQLISIHLYFDSMLMILGLINFGSLIEKRARKSALNSLINLEDMLPPKVNKLLEDGLLQTINLNQLQINDLVKIVPGDKLPADGVIIAGSGELNQAFLSGESHWIKKNVGDRVYAGSINQNGAFNCQISALSQNSYLAKIIQLVETSRLNKPFLASLADKITQYFVPIIILIAIFSALTWYFFTASWYYSLSVFMTVLIIACPCSIGLAIPMSLTVGLGVAAKNGVIIQDSKSLNLMDKLKLIVFDKTGTLTEGKMVLINITWQEGSSLDEAYLALYELSVNSEHPLARAILNYLKLYNKLLATAANTQEFKSYTGMGVSTKLNNTFYALGAKSLVEYLKVIKSNLLIDTDYTTSYLVKEQQVIARLEFSDILKPEAKEVIQKLKKEYEIFILSGDSYSVASKVAQELQVDNFYSNLKPTDKLAKIKALRDSGAVVLFVGDGINDAPSLSEADLSIAVYSGTELAKDSATISLASNSLELIIDAINYSKKINRNMRENLFGAFIYNSLAVLIASGIFYPYFKLLLNPLIASITMSLSSITVIFNALRLRKYTRVASFKKY